MRGVGYVAFSPRPVAEWIAAETFLLQNICFLPTPKDVRRPPFPTRYVVSLRTRRVASPFFTENARWASLLEGLLEARDAARDGKVINEEDGPDGEIGGHQAIEIFHFTPDEKADPSSSKLHTRSG